MKFSHLFLASFASIASTQAFSADQVTSYAESQGYRSCLSTVVDLETFFAEGGNYGAWTVVSTELTDDQVLSASLELTFDTHNHLIDFTVAPVKDGTCSYTYTRTWFNDKSCLATTKEEFMEESEYKGELNVNVTAFEDPSGAKIMLVPAGSGCLIQKKEIGLRHKDQNS